MISRLLFLSSFLMIFFNSFSQTHTISFDDKTYFRGENPRKSPNYIVLLKDSLPNGLYKVYLDSTHTYLIASGSYSQNKKNGVWNYYFDNGKVETSTTFKNNAKNGVSKWYDRSGNLIITRNYQNNIQQGLETVNILYGNPQYERERRNGTFNYLDGKLHGQANYTVDGDQFKVVENYDQGRKHGKSTTTRITGELVKVEVYENGKQTSEILYEGKTDATTYSINIFGPTPEDLKAQLALLKKATKVRELRIGFLYDDPVLDSLIIAGLKNMPNSASIRKITISGALTKIPEGVFQCVNLERLYFKSVCFTELPVAISKLQKLKILQVESFGSPLFVRDSNNRLQKVRDEQKIDPSLIVSRVKGIASLRELYLVGGFDSLPKNIGSLTQLKGLYLANYTVCTSGASPAITTELMKLKNLTLLQMCFDNSDPRYDELHATLPFCTHEWYQTCLNGNSLIALADGSTKLLSAMEIGDVILAFDEQRKQVIEASVMELHVFDTEQYTVQQISFIGNKTTIEATNNHPVFVNAGHWKTVSELVAGDRVFLINEETKLLEELKISAITEVDEKLKAVYNIKTSAGNYFANGILVHNK